MEMRVDHRSLRRFLFDVLCRSQVAERDAGHVADGLVQASLRGVDSHGVRLFPHYVRALRAGRINGRPSYRFERTAAAVGVLDADHAFGHAAGMVAVAHAVQMAGEAGMGAVAVRNSSHFGAAAFFGLEIARHDMIGLSLTHADALIVPTGGQQRFLGNNPVCFTAPCEGEEPLCLDMATSLITFNKVLQLREEGREAPPGTGADAEGRETTDPNRIVQLLPVGGYKGYGLSLMVETLCALLTGMPFGPHIARMYDAPIEERRYLGQFYLALRIDAFLDPAEFKRRMRRIVAELRSQPAVDPQKPVMVAGDPEKAEQARREGEGIPLRDVDVAAFETLGREQGVDWSLVAGTAGMGSGEGTV